MKKLIVLFVTIFCGTLFAAAEGDAGASLPPQRISHPLTNLPPELLQELIFPHLSAKEQEAFRSVNWEARCIPPRALTFNMQSVEDHEISRVSTFLAARKDIKTLKIKNLKNLRATILIPALRNLRDEGFRFASLTDLDLMDNRGIIPVLENIKPLAPNLMGLNVGSCGLGAESANFIRQMMPHLRDLNIGANNIGPAGAVTISQMPHLKTLNIELNLLGDAGAAAIAQMPHLRTLHIRCNFIGAPGAVAISQMPHLRTLNISSNCLGHEGAAAIAQMPNLVQLSIRHNYIEDAGAISIAQMPNLINLNIMNNNIGATGVAALNYLDQTRPIQIYGDSFLGN